MKSRAAAEGAARHCKKGLIMLKCKYAVAVLLIAAIAVLTSCKKPEKPAQPEMILKKWAAATEKNDYHAYRKCEVNPKEARVFREMFRTYFLRDIIIISTEELDRKDIHSDHAGNKYIKSNVIFSATEVSRKIRAPVQMIRGEVLFVKYSEGSRKDDGWLMLNRTLIRTKW